MPRVGRFDKWVTLSKSTITTNDNNGFFEPLSPAGVWCSIEPLPPSPDGRNVSHLVQMRHHPQIDMDTRLQFQTTGGPLRELFVRGFQNLNMDDELRLLCEEIIP
jgi:hypothetical protein